MNAKVKGTLLTLIGGTCWGVSGVVGKILFDEKGLNAQWLVTARLVFGGLLMLSVGFCIGRGQIFRIWKEKRTAAGVLLFAFFGMMLCQLTYFLCIAYSNPATATVLQYTSPVLIMLLCLFTEKKRPSFTEVTVLLIVMAGVFLMTTHGNIHSLAISGKALLYGALATLAVVFYTVWPVKLMKTYGSTSVVGWGMLLGGVILFPFSRFWIVPGTWDAQTVLYTAVVVIFGTVLSFGCYLKGVVYLGPVRGSMMACVEPLVSAILTVVWLHEKFEAADFIGMAAIVAGVTLLAVADNRKGE